MAWEMFDRDGAGGFRICGVDGDALADAPIAALPVGCEVTVQAETASPAALRPTEHDLDRFTGALQGRIVATSRTRTSLTTLVYLPSDDGVDRYSKIFLPRAASVSVAPAIDPEWTLFAAARPSGMEEQSMLDFRVRSELHAVGDVGGVRTIDHVVVGLTDDTVDDFTRSVSAVFDAVEIVPTGDDVPARRISHRADPSDVTESSWTIRMIAERFGATYDGWGCAVVAPEPRRSSRSSGRRWWRRS